MLDTREIVRKVRQIEIKTRGLVNEVMSGEYHAVFKGRGMNFSEVREYQIGDDVRTIDWNVSARMGKPFVKKFVEERELTVMVLVDASASTEFGAVGRIKSQLAAEVASLLSLAAIRNQDKVGLMMFTDRVEKFIPVRKGVRHVFRIVREVLSHKPQGQGTNIVQALKDLNKVMTRRAIVFVVSDFLGRQMEDTMSAEFQQLRRQLAVTNKRHDVILVTLNDSRERDMPSTSLIVLKDLETGRMLNVDAASAHFRNDYHHQNLARLNRRTRAFRSMGIDAIDAWTDRSFADDLIKLFKERKKR